MTTPEERDLYRFEGGKRVPFVCGPYEFEILARTAKARGESRSSVLRRLIRSLEQPPRSAS